jgi:hypothetical protein
VRPGGLFDHVATLAVIARAHTQVGTPEQAAEVLRPYIDAGFTGLTFNNPVVSTPEAIAAGKRVLLVA